VRDELILVVDDDLDCCRFMSTCLSAAGFRVAMAHRGADIVERALALAPRIIILDLEIPDLSGHAVLGALRADPRTSGIPVIMFSGCADDGWQALASENGSAACLCKPCSPELLVQAVRRTLARRPVPQAHQSVSRAS
jgi:DNA-binding response OmpR family regulator